MIRSNIEAEISSIECKIEQKHKEMIKITNLICNLADRHTKLSTDINDMIYKLNELREQLEEEND